MIKETYFCDWCGKKLTKREFWFSTSKVIYGVFGSLWTEEDELCTDCKTKLYNLIDEIKGIKKSVKEREND